MGRAVVVAALVLSSIVVAADLPLERDPARYLILASRQARLKDLAVAAPGCSLGVNCPAGGRRCGVLRGRGLLIAEPGQTAAADVCSEGSFFTVFRDVPASCHPRCGDIAQPGSAGDCTSPLAGPNALPILADVDGDGAPSCSDGCVVDYDDLAAACGVQLPLPLCDPTQPLVVRPGEDCTGGDFAPGNGRCDLPAGTYGQIVVREGARLDFAAGTTVVCGLRAGQAVRVTSAGPALVIVPGRGSVKLNNLADVGNVCGGLRFVTERGTVTFGRGGEFTVDACSLRGKLRLGHSNSLRGHFVGDVVLSNLNNDGRCCPSTTTTTTTTTTTSTSTTTTSPSTTTTTQTGSTTTTTTLATTTTTTTTTTTSTTTTTLRGGYTRTPGFYKTHPTVTAAIIAGAGGLQVCGRSITDVDVGHGHSALELMCVAVGGDSRLQLARQLMAAALSGAAGGAVFGDLAACNAICASSLATSTGITDCIDDADAFNNGGDALPAPFDDGTGADPKPCKAALNSACTISNVGACTAP